MIYQVTQGTEREGTDVPRSLIWTAVWIRIIMQYKWLLHCFTKENKKIYFKISEFMSRFTARLVWCLWLRQLVCCQINESVSTEVQGLVLSQNSIKQIRRRRKLIHSIYTIQFSLFYCTFSMKFFPAQTIKF